MEVYGIKYSNGKIRCEFCEQLLSENQQICPGCKNTIIGYTKVNSLFRTDYAEELQVKASRKKAKRGGKVVGSSILSVAAIVILFLKYAYPLINSQVLGDSNNVQLSEYVSKHSEEPITTNTIDGSQGHSYQIKQIFFETPNSKEIEDTIRTFFKDCEINYNNLYYTEKGYYTADLNGYGAYYSEAEYQRAAKELEDKINEWFTTHKGNALGGYKYVLQAWYLK